MIQFDTESGSTYEVDRTPGGPAPGLPKAGKVRRLVGTREPTPRQGTDCEWGSFYHISPITVGESVLIFWDSHGKATITSLVTEIRETDERD